MGGPEKGVTVNLSSGEMFHLTHTMKAGQQDDIGRKVRRGWLIAVVLFVVAFVAMGLLLN